MTSSSPEPPASTPPSVFRFGDFELDARAGELRRAGAAVKLQPQPFKVLARLVERAGDLVRREELKKALWGEETYVDFERGLNFCINQVRAALGDSPDTPQFIQTVPRRGYRFIAKVTASSESTLNQFRVGSESVQSQFRDGSESVQNPFRAGSGSTPNQMGWRQLTAAAAFIGVLAAGASYLARRTAPPPPTPTGRTMIAVLPFEDLTGDPPPPWFADGLTDELITQIGRVSPTRLGVIARTSAMTYRDRTRNIADIGRELRVSHVLEGSVRRDANRLRITVQLVAVSDQSPVWSETYDRTVHGTLTIQSEVAAQVTRALAVELLPAPWTTPTWAGTHVPGARDAYLRGRYFVYRGLPGDLTTALQHFDQAARLDPKFAAAKAAQADTYHRLAMFGQMPAADAYARASAAAREAVRLDPNLADAHAATGVVQFWSEWNPSAAAASYERALALNPSDATAHHDFAWALVALQRFDEAVLHITRARELDPLSPRANNDIGWLYLQIRQPSEAARACRHTLSLDPDSVEAQQCLERAHRQRGEFSEALAAARTAAARGRGPMPAAFEEPGTAETRLQSLWRWRLNRLRDVARERYVNPYTIAVNHVMLGEEDEALARLEQALAARTPAMVLLATDPAFDRLRSHPRFVKLIAQIKRAG